MGFLTLSNHFWSLTVESNIGVSVLLILLKIKRFVQP